MNRVIRAVKIFKSLSDMECGELGRFMRIQQYESGVLVFERGKLGDTMVVVADGALSVMMPGPRRRNIEVARVGVGEAVGEMSCIDPAPRSATLVAALRTTAYEFGRKDLIRMRELAPDLATALVDAIIRSVTLRLRRVDERIERELAGHLAARLPELRQNAVTPETADPGTEPATPNAWNVLLTRLRGSA
jgi:CRP/FNR family cyclic AMP-dependent transcriptional regulator